MFIILIPQFIISIFFNLIIRLRIYDMKEWLTIKIMKKK